mmetsp:Transcript_7117/g.17346  ORF Transcript_7117/g.17346 Transcript_7117/m.17346 type:complete len:234 (+) Transcript_7117:200-901(+)
MANWDLSGCCDKQTIIFLCCYGGYSLFTMFFMNTAIVKPMKLIAIFMHEMGHASAAWLTGGKVDKIEVWQNEGGVTNFRNGWKPAIIPAGYVGVSFWGGVLVALSGSKMGATVASGIFIFALLVCLRYSPNKLLVGLCVGFTIVTLAATLVEWLLFDPFLQFVTLFYGVFVGWYGIMDIWDDTISRTVEGSDAYACFQMWPCCLPKCVGIQFAILAIICQCLGLYIAMLSLAS